MVDPFYYVFDEGRYILISKDFLGGIYEKDVSAGLSLKVMLEPAPAFADTSFEQVALDRPLEKLFGNRNENSVVFLAYM